MAVSVLTRESVKPRSMFLMLISETPDAAARSVCFQFKKARAARICAALIMLVPYAIMTVGERKLFLKVIFVVDGYQANPYG